MPIVARSLPILLSWVLLWTLLGLRGVATFAPTSWLWGLDSLADRAAAVRILGFLLFAGAAVPSTGRWAVSALGTVRRRVPAALSGFLGLLAAAGLFVWLRTGHVLLGDTQTWISSIEKGMRSPGGAHREPLPQTVVTLLYREISKPLGKGADSSFLWVELVLGVCFLWLAAAIVRRLARTDTEQALLFGLIGLGGALQLFAGYAEFYGFAVAGTFLLLWLALRWLDGHGPLFGVSLAFVLAALCHAQLVFASPGILALLIFAWRDGRRKEAAIALAAIPVAALLGLLLLHYPFFDMAREARSSKNFLPPFGRYAGGTSYGTFTVPHLAELLDVALLVSPMFPLALALRGGKLPARRWLFLGGIALGPFLFALIASPGLGMVRDWDIFVLPVLLGTLWMGAGAAALLGGMAASSERDRAGGVAVPDPPGPARRGSGAGGGHGRDGTGARRRRDASGARQGSGGAATGRDPDTDSIGLWGAAGARGLAGCVLLTCLLHGVFWLQGNHLPGAARERIRRVAGNAAFFGPVSHGEVWRFLGSADLQAGDVAEGAASLLHSIRVDPDQRMTYRLLANIYLEAAKAGGKSAEDGLAEFHAALAKGKQRPGHAHLGACFAALSFQRPDLAFEEAREAAAAEPESPEHLATWGDLLRREGRFAEADSVYHRALSFDPANARGRLGLACLAGIRGDRAGLEAGVQEALRRRPWDAYAQQFQRLLQRPGGLSPEACQGLLYYR